MLHYHDFGVFNSLTDIERQVLARIVRGFPNKQIAAELYKSTRTIEGYRRRIGDKTGYVSMADLLANATRAGFRVLPYDKLNVSYRVEPTSVPARVGSGVLASQIFRIGLSASPDCMATMASFI
ncbi:MAG: LuxR C-terminal-related transcriptional regulator [Planctomycetota bacterium]